MPSMAPRSSISSACARRWTARPPKTSGPPRPSDAKALQRQRAQAFFVQTQIAAARRIDIELPIGQNPAHAFDFAMHRRPMRVAVYQRVRVARDEKLGDGFFRYVV